MFTGLVEELGTVTARVERSGGCAFEVAAPRLAPELAAGDSVAVSGACQTVIEREGGRFRFYAMGETLRASTLGALRPGARVNLERALTLGGRLGGHLVTGHVDGVGRLEAVCSEGGWTRLRVWVPADLMPELVPKGSLAVDGISLTVGPALLPEGCELFIIPHTLAATTLGGARPGDRVNLETDILGKYVRRLAAPGGDRDARLASLLAEHGFIGKDKA
ncbi:MAG: riboflavin synthase [Candidatus Krumholzibacteriota bacterium]|nr:riboflavin synthase [Candidatus Krumholzibacteriota bacterium]